MTQGFFTLLVGWLLAALAGEPPALPPAGIGGPAQILGTWLTVKGHVGRPKDLSELERLLSEGEAVYLDGGSFSAAARFGAALLDPAWLAHVNSPTYDNLIYDLAGSLAQQGALGKSRALLLGLIGQKPPSSFRPSAFRKLADLCIESGQYEQTLTSLNGVSGEMTADEKDEIAYLKARAMLALGFAAQANAAFDAVSRTSRHRAAAVYLQGVASLDQGDLEQATSRFCGLVRAPKAGRYTFFVSPGAAEIVDHSWLALGSIRHDSADHGRAFDSFARVGRQSRAFSESRYRQAWSLYSLGQFAQARQLLLDWLGQPMPSGGAEPWLLLAYATMGDCLYEEAQPLFSNLIEHLRSQSDTLETDLKREPAAPMLSTEAALAAMPSHQEQAILSLPSVVLQSFALAQSMRVQLRQLLRPEQPLLPQANPDQALMQKIRAELSHAQSLQQRLANLRAHPGMRQLTSAQVKELEAVELLVRQSLDRAKGTWQALQQRAALSPALTLEELANISLPGDYLMAEDRELRRMGLGLSQLWAKSDLLAQGTRRAQAERASEKLGRWVRQAVIGQIDAVIGKKQSLEFEVQNLALGRYPMSLLQELAASGALDETMEYWPYDGEIWPDELQ